MKPFDADEEATLRERARRIEVDADAGLAEARDRADVVIVRVARDRYALPAADVRAVADVVKLTPAPNAPPHVAGFASHRGEILVVFFLHAVLGVPTAPSEHGSVVVLDDGLALAVDAVEKFASFDAASLREPPSDLTAASAPFVRGVFEGGVTLLDADALARTEQLVVDVPRLRTGEKRTR